MKPMVFGTIKNQMEAKDGNWYKNVREIYADVRLVFTNAMKYNDDQSDVHVMAKSLLENFEEKWLPLLAEVAEEEARQKNEEAQTLANMRNSRKAAYSKIARETYNELDELNSQLEELRAMVIKKCRKMTTEEKRKLGVGLSTLSSEDLNKALEIIAEDNPGFQATDEVVDLDLDAQSESTLWKLKFFVKRALENQGKNSARKADDNLKRKREIICEALVKSAAKKRNKKLPVS
ncbi:transcription factor GTE1-like isoform X1 [Zingiber officinale]|uniref:transcription factor GTE1-like isoform X1 n=1 Tax=Zingiber officinale TaxID=94328 RepID=UPI001C4B8AD2|nr:transcription factor GTE1-like isoform X1 [Zingiber officinale]XP_042399150.1 transcription factor GTE1-like isoform X1 [Zingiber officinale]